METCADNAGYIKTVDGVTTSYRARVQVTIFNALSRTIGWANRRSHDKLIVVVGAFPDKAVVITGGRNISLSYYGITADGA